MQGDLKAKKLYLYKTAATANNYKKILNSWRVGGAWETPFGVTPEGYIRMNGKLYMGVRGLTDYEYKK